MRFRDLVYEFKWRFIPRHRYNIVRTGLQPGYYDQDTRLLHACFALLVDYVDEEGGVGAIASHADNLQANPEDWVGGEPGNLAAREAMEPHIRHNEEVLALHHWWTELRPKARTYNGYDWLREDALDAEDQAMLHRLIDIRPRLWV